MKIYTKTGDKGETGLFGGKRVQKNHKIIEALGTIDELNAWMGILKLTDIQKDLMVISAQVAGFSARGGSALGRKSLKVEKLEKEIDRMQEELPELRNFILPKGQIHLARAVCRRAERRIIDSGIRRNDTLKYLNRLSDYLFVLARHVNFKSGNEDTTWSLI